MISSAGLQVGKSCVVWWRKLSGSILQWTRIAEQWIKEGKYALNWTRL